MCFHSDVLRIAGSAGNLEDYLGVSGAGSAVFPSSLLEPALQLSTPLFTYIDADGHFYCNKTYYSSMMCERDITVGRLEAESPVRDSLSPPSRVGNLSLEVTIRPHLGLLYVRTTVDISGKIFELKFMDLHLANMALSFAKACNHNFQDAIDNDPTVMPTSAASPVAREGLISLAGKHQDPKAQFLCGVRGVRTLFQGDSCLRCAIDHARNHGSRMIIRS